MFPFNKLKEHTYRLAYKLGNAHSKILVVRTYKQPNGTVNDYLISKEADSAQVFALTQDNKVLVVRQFRPALEKETYEFPGGAVDEGEKPRAAAYRELLEETGYEAGEMIPLAKLPLAVTIDCTRHLYIATGCHKVAEQQLDQNEFAVVQKWDLDKVYAAMLSGKLSGCDLGYIALHKLGLLKLTELT